MRTCGKLLAKLWWRIDPSRWLDAVPGFAEEYERQYNQWALHENQRARR